MRRETRADGALLLRRLASWCDELGEQEKSERIQGLARELAAGPGAARERQLWADVVRELRGGHGTIGDRYLAHPDGSPDPVRSAELLSVLRQLRRAARRSLPWLTYRRLWKVGR
ncbi:hypothetical protein DNL40_06325 [Xylanimonas oleitrophica]|uniref:Uncharacterized protein n=1 Tax=Xylanimonas oleitrophica TaxID=2607479 RepID=A0A2W5WZC5_9MICO|nr:hypothetical protein [Xylanimonas oleitrophica]PZR53736.1 hypothetical protein DNL40_06325 [Xylanimonas oleitrophica]